MERAGISQEATARGYGPPYVSRMLGANMLAVIAITAAGILLCNHKSATELASRWSWLWPFNRLYAAQLASFSVDERTIRCYLSAIMGDCCWAIIFPDSDIRRVNLT